MHDDKSTPPPDGLQRSASNCRGECPNHELKQWSESKTIVNALGWMMSPIRLLEQQAALDPRACGKAACHAPQDELDILKEVLAWS